MSKTVHYQYAGWDVTIRCMEQLPRTPGRESNPFFTAVAHARLQSAAPSENWTDPRPQIINTGRRTFPDGEQCTVTMFSEVKILIDSLRRERRLAGGPNTASQSPRHRSTDSSIGKTH